MILGLAGSVTSLMVIQVALPKAVIALKPSSSGVAVLTIGLPLESVPEVLLELN